MSKVLTEILEEYFAKEINSVGADKTLGQLELLKCLLSDLQMELNISIDSGRIAEELNTVALNEKITQRYFAVERLHNKLCMEIKLCNEEQLSNCIENYNKNDYRAEVIEISADDYANAKLRDMNFPNGVEPDVGLKIISEPEIYWGKNVTVPMSYAERQLAKPPLPDIISLTWNREDNMAYLENYNPGMFVANADFSEIDKIIKSFGAWRCDDIKAYAAALNAAQPYIQQALQYLPEFAYETATLFFRDNHGSCTPFTIDGYPSCLCWDDKNNCSWLELNYNSYANTNEYYLAQQCFSENVGKHWGVKPCSNVEQYNSYLEELGRGAYENASFAEEQDIF